MNAAGQSAAADSAVAATPFWPTVWLIVTLIAIKASYLQLSTFWSQLRPLDSFWICVGWIASVSQADALVGLTLGLVATAAIFPLRGNKKWTTAITRILLMVGVVCIVYAVVSRQLFAYYFAPATFQLFSLGGEPGRLWSSLEDYFSVAVIVALVGLPLAYVWLSAATARVSARGSPRTVRQMRAGLLVVLLAWLAGGQVLQGSNWFTAQERHFPESPHWVLLQSILMSSSTRAGLSAAQIRPEDLAELSPGTASAQRPPTLRLAGATGSIRPKNIVLIVMESVGARYLSLYGSQYDTTPNLVAEQKNALVFRNYYAPVGWTAYSLIALVLSQRPPMERYNEVNFRANPGKAGSIAESLNRAGYRSAFMSSGDPNWASPGLLERQGFSEIYRGQDLPGAVAISSWGTQDRFLFDSMLGWIDEHRTEPFFVMAWTDQTHQPYKVAPDQNLVQFPTTGKDREPLARYLGLIRATDAQIGRLLQGLRDRGLADDTLVVITGDHGESFGEPHGGGGHGFTVYDEEVHVPLMLWNPRLFAGSGRSDVVGTHVDLAPTLLDLVGLPAPGNWDGRSLFDPLHQPRAFLFAAAWGQYLLGVRDHDMKYSYDARLGREELYDLASDPDEQRNLAAAQPEVAVRLRQRLAALLQVENSRSAARKARSVNAPAQPGAAE
jgi:arylsulfatase A-like enzyme